MAGRTIGLDFGTTNSLIAYVDAQTPPQVQPILNRDDTRPHPSTIWYRAGEVIVGRAARSQLEGQDIVSGNFVRSPKRLLGTDGNVNIDGMALNPTDIVAHVLSFLKADAADPARKAGQQTVDRAVMTIPVDLDGPGRRRLREAASKAGIRVEQFVHEPLAALYAWLRTQPDPAHAAAELEGKRMLVFDWGGGTLDLTLCLLRHGRLVQIDNDGDNEVGGDWVDDVIRQRVRERHAAEHGIANIRAVEAAESGTRLTVQCERAKIQLSEGHDANVYLRNYLRADPGRDLNVDVSRDELNRWTRPMIDRGLALIDRLLEHNELTARDIELCLPTGGMVSMPAVREGLVQRFQARALDIPNGDRIIAEGAAWIAHDQLRLSLAKPIEVEQPDGGFLQLAHEGQRLPVENETQQLPATQFYCVDPRDGVAHFHFARPRKVGYGALSAPRASYCIVSVAVDPYQPPFLERLNIEARIDQDFVVAIDIRSTGRGASSHAEIHDLEFALDLPDVAPTRSKHEGEAPKPAPRRAPATTNARLRPNVTMQNNRWSLVPGDIVDQWRPSWFDRRANNATPKQLAEYAYYVPCATCKRSAWELELHGCDQCAGVVSVAAAAVRRAELEASMPRA